MTIYSFTYHHRNGCGSRTAWYSTAKEAKEARRLFQRRKCGENGSFICDNSGVVQHTVANRSDLIGLLSGLTNGYEIDGLLS
jgi:hypothetical protein